MENRLMTIVFLDMQGYTKRSAQQTIEEMKLFHDQMFKFVSEIVERWNGIMVKTMGDGFMVRFDSPTNAVRAGLEIQKKLDARNAQMMNPDNIVRFRIGINTGEVGIDENGDLFGDPVNIAARIQTFADCNDVFISEATYLAMNKNEFGAVDLGAQELKNATREIRIYKILKNGSPGMIVHNPTKDASNAVLWKEKSRFLIPVIVGIVILALVTGIVIGKKRSNSENRFQNSAVKTISNAKPEEESAEKDNPVPLKKPDSSSIEDDQKNRTVMDLDPYDRRLKFSPAEREIFAQVKKMRAEKNYEQAELACSNMIKSQPGPKKLPWTLVLAELFYEQKKFDDAEKLCKNIAHKISSLPGPAQKKLNSQIEKMRNKYK
ncbi:MAG: hypothetical protein Kow0029_08690 [Candidatus Rifleibacteriota bacterium]